MICLLNTQIWIFKTGSQLEKTLRNSNHFRMLNRGFVFHVEISLKSIICIQFPSNSRWRDTKIKSWISDWTTLAYAYIKSVFQKHFQTQWNETCAGKWCMAAAIVFLLIFSLHFLIFPLCSISNINLDDLSSFFYLSRGDVIRHTNRSRRFNIYMYMCVSGIASIRDIKLNKL